MLIVTQLPWQSLLLGFAKVLYDRELSVSEHNVKVSNILNNHSLIMGKQIINILPEGSAVLNPEHIPFCLSSKSRSSVDLPVYFNATVPAEIEFTRIDLETNREETIKLSKSDMNKLVRKIKDQAHDPLNLGSHWAYPVKKPGVYRLSKVLDEYKLEVQRASQDTYVVTCPRAKFRSVDSSQRCIRDLSDLSVDVIGTPPLKIAYSRTTNGANNGFHIQSLQPDGFRSPLLPGSSSLVASTDTDVSWLRPSTVNVVLNESLTMSGEWIYSVDEVSDAFGNVVTYEEPVEDVESPRPKGLSQKFTVRERPKVRMNGCDLRHPLRVAKGASTQLPVNYGLSGPVDDTSHQITWEFSPIDSLTNSGDHGDKISAGSHAAKNSLDKPRVSEPGLYTLRSVSSGSCEGEVDEPSSCLLLNPLEPHLSLRSEEIPDKCAGNTIGLRVDLDLVGTPPFKVRYDVITDKGVRKEVHSVSGLRSQLELVPLTAGRYRYVFKSIDDAVYSSLPLTGQDKVLEQVVKPAASAYFSTPSPSISACLDAEVEVEVALTGDPPFSLEWETVHDGKRKKEHASNLEGSHYKIKTAPLSKGGDYIMALGSVQDKRGCRTFLQDQMKISVRRQQPRGGFGAIEQKAEVKIVEGTTTKLPLRLQGEGPWTVSYRNLDGSGEVETMQAKSANDFITVGSRGTYEIVGIADSQCPGTVDSSASSFKLSWYPRPEISVVESSSIKPGPDKMIKQEICEGDIDGFEVNLSGKSLALTHACKQC